jgi:signal transduction histidine kinase
LESSQSTPWSETEGTVNFASLREGSLFLEVSSGYGPISVEVVDAAGASPLLLLGSRVKMEGFCETAHTPGGQRVAGAMVTPGMAQVRVLDVPSGQWTRYPLQSVGQLAAVNVEPEDDLITHVRGRIVARQEDGKASLQDETGVVELQLAAPVEQTNKLVEVLGRLRRSETNIVLTCAVLRLPAGPANATDQLPLLTSVRQVKQLSREQAQQGYPAKIHGVITLVRGDLSGFIIQDDTSAIDVWWTPYSNTSQPRVGDYWEVEGETFAEFSPNIRAHSATRLGAGTLPDPIHPAWDQLLNGSLDTLYVEVQGIVTATEPDAVMLLTRDGKIRVLLSPVTPELLKHRENALVRIRGCVVPVRDQLSHQVQVGQIRLSNVSLNMDEPPPADPFAAVLKHASELLLFDARAGSLQRVKVAGQVMHVADGEIFLRDGDNTVRVLPQKSVKILAGDLAEVVGFPKLGGPSPVLCEALVRPTGHAPLPQPLRLGGDALFSTGHDGLYILVEAQLLGVSGNETEKWLELQSGSREFVARLENRRSSLLKLVPGSRLQLTGVYSDLSGGPGQPFTSFELLLNSPLAVNVLELPPWWTLRRALIFAGGLAGIILAALFWIVLLRRRVEERSAQLATEVRRREQIQRQSALEKERTRIAKDMHDQLGTSVTQVSLLAELARKNAGDPRQTAAHAEKISATALELGRTLDEIVWAVNPKNDSLDRFCDYVAVQAQELFQLTDVLCRVDLPPEMPGYPLSAEVRHNVFLAAKEALNNVVRHAKAREVWVRFKWEAATFQITIVDDGRGFDAAAKPGLRNGLQNMKKRLEEAGGRFAIASQPGRGTEVTLEIRLASAEPNGLPGPAESSVATNSSDS